MSQLFATPWTVAHQAHLSMGFSRQEYRSGMTFPSPGDLPDSGIQPASSALQIDSLPSEPPGKPLPTKPASKKNKSRRLLGEKTYLSSFLPKSRSPGHVSCGDLPTSGAQGSPQTPVGGHAGWTQAEVVSVGSGSSGLCVSHLRRLSHLDPGKPPTAAVMRPQGRLQGQGAGQWGVRQGRSPSRASVCLHFTTQASGAGAAGGAREGGPLQPQTGSPPTDGGGCNLSAAAP